MTDNLEATAFEPEKGEMEQNPEQEVNQNETQTDERGEEAGEGFEKERQSDEEGKRENGQSQRDETQDIPEKFKGKELKDVIKSYEELEKMHSRKAQELADLKKRTDAFEREENQKKEEALRQAKNAGFSSVEEQQASFLIKDREFRNYVAALDVVPMDEESRQAARQALAVYQRSGGMDTAALMEAKSFFPANVVEQIAQDTQAFKGQVQGELLARQQTQRQSAIQSKIEEIKEKFPELLSSRQSAVFLGTALNLTGGNLNVEEFNRMFSDLKEHFFEEFQKNKELERENKNLQDRLQAPSSSMEDVNGNKWLTKEEYDALTPDEEDAKYDLINRQAIYQREGKLEKKYCIF